MEGSKASFPVWKLPPLRPSYGVLIFEDTSTPLKTLEAHQDWLQVSKNAPKQMILELDQ